MIGLNQNALDKIKNKGKVIKGAGTTTSDDIDMSLPQGSFILPADSTAALGLGGFRTQENIPFTYQKELGESDSSNDNDSDGDTSVDTENDPQLDKKNVKVSHGEYVIPPSAVAEIGADNLETLRQITHMPTKQQETGKLYFADGGLINSDEELRRRNQQLNAWDLARGYGLGTTAMLAKAGSIVNNNPALYSQVTKNGIGSIGSNAGNLMRANAVWSLGNGAVAGLNQDNYQRYRDRFGLGEEDYNQNPVVGGLKAAAVQTLGAATDVADSAGWGLPSKILAGTGLGYLDKNMAKHNAVGQKPQAQPTPQVQNNTATSVANPFQTQQNKPQSWEDDPEIQAIFKTPSSSPATRNNGKQVMSNAEIDAIAPPLPKGVQQLSTMDYKDPAQTELAMRALQTVGSNIQQPNVRTPIAPTRGYEARLEREKLLDKFSTVQNGARGLTATQLRGLQELAQGDDNIAQNAYNQQMQLTQAQMREQGDMQRAVMNEQGQNARAMLNEAGTDSRYQMGYGLNMARLNADSQNKQAQLGLDVQRFNQEKQQNAVNSYPTTRLAALQVAYDNAKTDAERKAILEKANATIGGKGNGVTRDDFVSVDAGVDAAGNDLGQVLYNVKTGQTINPRNNAGKLPINQNPEALAIKNDTKLTVEQKQAKLKELGYSI